MKTKPYNLKFGINILAYSLLTILLFASCKNNKPDTSKIDIQLEVVRFEKDFFALDTNNINLSMQQLNEKHQNFNNDFLLRILGLEGVDTTIWTTAIKQFIRDYTPMYSTIKTLDPAIDKSIDDTKDGLKLVKYYFPNYKLPEQFITFIGPIDAYASNQTGGSGDIITTFALAAGLQLHLGTDASIYNTDIGRQLYPTYISRKFNVENIPVNAMKNVIDELLPPIQQGSTLLEIFVDHGKRMYLLDLFLPDADDTLKLGYTPKQLEIVSNNEGLIWNYFQENNLLFETDGYKVRPFTTAAPSTIEFGEDSPGFISLFVGRQIIKEYLRKNSETDINSLLKLDANKILAGSKYKPR